MRYVKQTIPLLLLAVFALANLAQAEVRGAASKIMGSYDQFDRSSNLRAAPVFSTPQAASEAPASRAYSFNPETKTGPRDAAPPATAASQAARQPTATRRFSYNPGMSAPSQSRSRGWQGGVRGAASKIEGNY